MVKTFVSMLNTPVPLFSGRIWQDLISMPGPGSNRSHNNSGTSGRGATKNGLCLQKAPVITQDDGPFEMLRAWAGEIFLDGGPGS